MTELVGIVNLTPDSFSGDGLIGAVDQALLQIDAMITDGASVIDIGAQSTRPGAALLSFEEEWERLEPLLDSLGERLDRVQFSIDTGHFETAERALQLGFAWLNDTSNGRNPAMASLAQEYDATYVLMHAMSVPADPAQTLAPDANPAQIVLAWAEAALLTLEKEGLERSNIVIDPGIGFGKTAEQSLLLIRDIALFKALGAPIMVGHSRKSFLSIFTDKQSAKRDEETLIVSKYLVTQGVDYLRVHNVKAHGDILRMSAA